MSRIEEALEKAARLREQNQPPLDVPPNVTGASSIKNGPGAFPQIDPIPLRNELLVTATEPQSAMAEEYRKLKEMVIKLTSADHTKNTLMVTSAMIGEGKSITALNLAISMAQEYDHTVLLIDGDLRKPSIDRYLDLGPRPGLTECLLDNADVAGLLVKTGVGKLVVLPAGRIAPNPAELFSSSKMRSLILEMKHRYADRFIIIDTPPVLPFAETRTLSGIVDGVIVVVKSGLSPLEDVQDALDAMRGANILGLVYNQVTVDALSSSYAYYYNNYSSLSGNGKK